MEMPWNERFDVVLSVVQALLGKLTGKLRAVAADWDESEVRVFCNFNGEVSDDDKERMSLASTQVATDFIDRKSVQFFVSRMDAPARLPDHQAYILLSVE